MHAIHSVPLFMPNPALRILHSSSFSFNSLSIRSSKTILAKNQWSTCAISNRTLSTMTTTTEQQQQVNGNGQTKRARIVTHDGTFHCDETLAVYLLRTHVAQFRDGEIIRTRDREIINTGDVVVDVGGEYDVNRHRYDHHQRGFNVTFQDKTTDNDDDITIFTRTKLSSAGLIYRHFGQEIIQSVLKANNLNININKDNEKVYFKVYENFIEAIDAIDNGISQFDSTQPAKYQNKTDLSSRVEHMNPDWYEQNPDIDTNFHAASRLTGYEFEQAVLHVVKSWLPARDIVAKALERRMEDDSTGNIVVLREWAPWKDHIYHLEGKDQKILYVLYQDTIGRSWRVQCVPVSHGSFESRKPLPENWRGVRDEQLSLISGIDGCDFTHASGFIGGNKTFEGAMQMARKALQA